jgi:hypothetical protein
VGQTPVATRLDQSFGFGPRFAFEYPFAERFAAFAFGEALFPPEAVGIGIVEGGPNGEPAPNVVWYQSVVSGFFGAGLSVQFK